MSHRISVEAGKGRTAWKRRAACVCGWHGPWYSARDLEDAWQDGREHKVSAR